MAAFVPLCNSTQEATHSIIYSYDTDFDRFPEIVRREPEPAADQAA